MQTISVAYLLCFAALVPIFRVAPARWRATLLAAAGLGFLATHGVYALVMAVGIVGVLLLATRALASGEAPDRRLRAMWAALAVLVGHLVLWKLLASERALGTTGGGREAFPGYLDVVAPAGLSYLTFKAVHVVLELYREKAPRTTVAELAAYLFFVPTWLAGPLGRVGPFQADLAAPRALSLPVANAAVARILFGILKKVLVADWLGRTLQPMLFAPTEQTRAGLLLAVYGVALQLYVDFSAATDIAVGSGRLLGIEVPENFDRPLTRPNIAEFWRSWHTSLYTFIRDYVFFPIAGWKASRLTMYVGVVVSISLFQVWHRISWNFLLLGLFHGGAVAVWQFVQERKRRSPWLRRALDHRAAYLPCVFATVSVYALGNVFFMAPVGVAFSIFRTMLAP